VHKTNFAETSHYAETVEFIAKLPRFALGAFRQRVSGYAHDD